MRSLNPGFESRNFQDPKPLVPNIDENIYEINKEYLCLKKKIQIKYKNENVQNKKALFLFQTFTQ